MPNVDVTIRAIDQGSQNVQKFGLNLGNIATKAIAAGVGLGALKMAFGTLESAASAAMAAINEGAALELAQSRFENLAASIGTTADALTGQMAAATQGMMSNAQMVSAASDIISLGLADSGDEVVRLSNLVGQLGWDMQVLTLTMANDSMLRLDALGLSMENVTAKMEALKAAGVSADEAFDLAVIEAGEEKLELLGSAAESGVGKIQQLTSMWQNATDAFKVNFAEGAIEQLGALADAIAANTPGIEQGMGELGERAGKVIGRVMATAAADGLYLNRKEIEDQLKEVGVSGRELGQLRQQALDNTGLEWGQVATDGRAMLEYEVEAMRLIEERYGVQLALIALEDTRAEAIRTNAARGRTALDDERGAVVALEGTYVGITDQYYQMADASQAYYGSFEYGQMVTDQQAQATQNLIDRQEAYVALMERYRQTMAEGGDFFTQQAGAEGADRLFNDNMVANMDAFNQLVLGMADNAGVGAIGLADLNVQMGEMEPAAARALVAATAAQEAIDILISSWQGGVIDTSGLLENIDAVIAELQNKTLPEIELEIKTKIAPIDLAPGERRAFEAEGLDTTIAVEGDLSPFEAALSQALGQVTGAPAADRTIQILADYEAVMTAAESDIPGAIQGIPEAARTVEFIPNAAAVHEEMALIHESRLTVYVDYVSNNAPPPGKAAGGPVAGGSPYWVGEVGPELFIPWANGTIVPNHRIGQMTDGGGVSMVLNFYGATDAADTRKAVDTAGRRLIERLRQAGVVS